MNRLVSRHLRQHTWLPVVPGQQTESISAARVTCGETVWPASITLHKAEKELEVVFNTGEKFTYPASLLRMESPAAGKRPKQGSRLHVGIMLVEPVGRYGIRLQFDDLHGSGIFTWQYLYDMGKRMIVE